MRMASWCDEKILDEIKTTGFCGCLIINEGTINKFKFCSEPEKRKDDLVDHLKKHSGELQLIIKATIANPALEEFRSDGCLVTITKTKWQVCDKLDFFQNGQILRAHPEYFTVSLQYLQGVEKKNGSSSNIVSSHTDIIDRQSHLIKARVSGSKLHLGGPQHKRLPDLVSTVSELYQSGDGVPDCALGGEFYDYEGWQGHKKGLQDLHADSVSQLNHGRRGNEDGQRHNNTERKRKLRKGDLDVSRNCVGDLRGHRLGLSKKPKDSFSVGLQVVDVGDYGHWNRGQGGHFQNEPPLMSGTTTASTSSHGGDELGHGPRLSMSENDTGVNETCSVSSSCDYGTERKQGVEEIDDGVTHSHDGIPFKDNLVLVSQSSQQRRTVVLPVRRKLQECGTHECTPKKQAIPRQRDRFRIDSEELSEAMKLQAYATPTVTSEFWPDVSKQDCKITSTSSGSFQNVLGVVMTPLKHVKKLFH